MKNQIIAALICSAMITVSCKKESVPAEPIKDADGNVYTEVKIGTQTWLRENLKTTRFRNGDLIPNITDFTEWRTLPVAAYCDYNNDASIGNSEGRLYNWFAVKDARNICPPGYHIPTAAEIQILFDYLGGRNVAGGKMKMAGETFWTSNVGATNESGFSGIGGGTRNTDPIADPNFIHRKGSGFYWTSTANANPGFENYAGHLQLQNNMTEAFIFTSLKTLGMSVRCIKD